MIRLAIVGDIGSGKSYIAKQFGYPVFNADDEVAKLYRKSRKCYNKLKKTLPEYIVSFPVKKIEISKAIIADQHNLKKIIKIVHPEVRSSMNNFIKKNKNKKFVILDIPLLIENKINFLLKGEELGNETANGKMMFICQAQLAFKIWHNVLPKIDYETIKLLGGQTASLSSF